MTTKTYGFLKIFIFLLFSLFFQFVSVFSVTKARYVKLDSSFSSLLYNIKGEIDSLANYIIFESNITRKAQMISPYMFITKIKNTTDLDIEFDYTYLQEKYPGNKLVIPADYLY